MSWADAYIAQLQAGKGVSFRPRGNSMAPRIASGARVTVQPVAAAAVRRDDIVLCRVRRRQYLHIVHAIAGAGSTVRFLIGNNHGGRNGWIGPDHIYGRCTVSATERA